MERRIGVVDFEAHTQTPGNGSREALATCPSNDVEMDGKGAETDGIGRRRRFASNVDEDVKSSEVGFR